MDQQTFNHLRDLIYDRSGISLKEGKEALVSARVGKRLRELGLSDEREYYRYVTSSNGEEELVQLLDVISTNVTYFFRESQHFTILEQLLNQWKKQGQTKFRIWSSASSTGEEPYSIAMVVAHVLGESADWEILATDIAPRVLEQCRNAVYSCDQLEKIPTVYHKYLEKNGNQFKISKELRSHLHFARLNLSTPPFAMRGPFDVIFCRNVMIYFDNPVKQRLVKDFHRLLKGGGFLMIGHSESLSGVSADFSTIRASIYRKENQ